MAGRDLAMSGGGGAPRAGKGVGGELHASTFVLERLSLEMRYIHSNSMG